MKYHLNEKLVKTSGNQNHLPFEEKIWEKDENRTQKFVC